MKESLLTAVLTVAVLTSGSLLAADDTTHRDHGSHNHGTLSLTDIAGAPTVRLRAERDPMAGWNIQIVTERFRFAPERVNQTHAAGEGHAHLYVDGKKVARVYGPWFHLGPQTPGKHELRVTLNANSHEELAVKSKKIEATAVIEQ